MVTINDWRARDTPHVGNETVELRDVVFLPDHLTGLNLQTEQVARGADDVHPVPVDRRRRSWPDGVRDHQHPIRGRPLADPQDLPGLLVERDRPLGPVHRPRRRIRRPVGDEHPAVDHSGTGKPPSWTGTRHFTFNSAGSSCTIPFSDHTPARPVPRHSGQSFANAAGAISSAHPASAKHRTSVRIWRFITR